MIAKLIMQDETLKTNIVVCDSAEPKSIDELRLAGVRSIPADKGADSIRNGIDLMKQYKINITKSSVNLIKEFRNYRWKQDRDGKSLNVPIDIFNHGIDATRYAVTYLLGSQNKFIKPKIHIPK
jgi:phage terminase large subunit